MRACVCVCVRVCVCVYEGAGNYSIPAIYALGLTVDGGHLSRSGDDLSATNGVVHKIDKVLIPESLQNQL